jgi:magnesium-transporting ATPase (P-type)
MPLIARLFLKTGMTWFLIALLLGVVQQIDTLLFPSISALFWHTLMLGWITQIIMGVSTWMFPGRMKVESFQNQRWSWLAYGFLNVGLIIRIISEPFISSSDWMVWKYLLAISAVIQFLGVVSYVIEIWSRVLSKKQRMKKKRAEG